MRLILEMFRCLVYTLVSLDITIRLSLKIHLDDVVALPCDTPFSLHLRLLSFRDRELCTARSLVVLQPRDLETLHHSTLQTLLSVLACDEASLIIFVVIFEANASVIEVDGRMIKITNIGRRVRVKCQAAKRSHLAFHFP